MPRLLLLTPSELTADPRARRQAAAAFAAGVDVVGLCGRIGGAAQAPLAGLRVVRVGRAGRTSARHEAASPRREVRLLQELRGIVRLLRLGLRTIQLARAGRRLGRFDIVHANDLDTIVAGWLLARRNGAELVYDAHELYSEFDAEAPRLARRILLSVEALLARRAATVVTVSGPLADELRRRLRLRTRPLVVLNAPARNESEPSPDASGFVYQGAFGPGRPLEDLLAAAARAPSVRLTIRVVRFDTARLRDAVAAHGLVERVAIAEPLPPDRLLDGLRDFGVGVIFDRPATRNSELSLPNKLFEYLMAGLAVVVPRLEALGPFVDEHRVGIAYEAGSTDALAEALEELATSPALTAELRANARRLALERFNAEAQEQTLLRAWGL